jgi:hypothetical protein
LKGTTTSFSPIQEAAGADDQCDNLAATIDLADFGVGRIIDGRLYQWVTVIASDGMLGNILAGPGAAAG